jgi:SAM-dependent methyltransferase
MKISPTRRLLVSCWLLVLIVGGCSTVYWIRQTYAPADFSFPSLAAAFFLVAALTTVNLALRWIRWHYLTRRLGVNFQARDSLLIYGATLPAAVTPFYLGELIRPFLAGRKYPTQRWNLVGIWFLERGTDLAALALFEGVAREWIWLIALVCIGWWLWILAIRAVARRYSRPRFPDARALAITTTLTVCAWAIVVAGLWISERSADGHLTMRENFDVFATSTIEGSIVGLPSGVGLMGSRLISLLELHGLSGQSAVVVTAIFRLGTVWFAVGCGILIAILWRRRIASLFGAKGTSSHFDDIADEYEEQIPEHVRIRLLARKTAVMRKHLDAHLPASGQLSGLDIGCGQGWYTAEMAHAGYQIRGIDESSKQIERARILHANELRLDFQTADAAELPFPDNTFDFAYAINVMHHITDNDKRARAFNEIARVLKPRGIFFLQEINVSNPFFRFYMAYVFPLIRSIDEGTEKWIDPHRLPNVTGGSWQTQVDYFTFIPDFAPAIVHNMLQPIEHYLERSIMRTWSAHYVARLTRFSELGASASEESSRRLASECTQAP